MAGRSGITRREFVREIAGGAFALTAAGCLPSRFMAAGARKPNILLIYIDDLGWKDVAFMGSRYYETPNIDRLAGQGIVFSSAYSNGPSCAPSRACMMSGQYTPHHGVYMVGRADRGPAHLQKLVPTPNTRRLRPDIVTMAEALKAGGYATCHIGKWHLGDDPEFGPHSQGFDVNIAGSMAGMPKTYFSPYKMKMLADGPEGEYLTDRLTEEACGFMEANRHRPFFLYMSHYAVHVPIEAKERMIAKYERKPPDGEQKNPAYAAMIESTDQGVGRLMAKLEELGIADCTVVVFYSDNGGQLGITEQKLLRAGKGYLYEGGIRVPMIVCWPGVTQAGRWCSTPVIGTDLYPTFLEVGGIGRPKGRVLSGESIVPLLRGDSGKLKRQAIFWHFPCYQPGSRNTFRITPSSAVRQGDWKLTEHFEDGRLELYNLEEDIGETNDLAEAMPGKAGELRAVLEAWRRSVNARVPTEPNPDYNPTV